MKILNRILILFYVLILLVSAAALAVAMWSPSFADQLLSGFNFISDDVLAKWVVTLVAVVLVLLSIEIFAYGCSGDKKPTILVKSMENGQVRVAVSTVEQIALKAAKNTEGVREVNVSASDSKEGVAFNLTMAITAGAVIPVVTENVQRAVKEEVENITSLAVSTVQVFVDNGIVKNK